ncbi:general substrate transporter [Coprinellus micaceus]|uniref:General substrate transporter n=1 Tax=Coprinellus micaceus TaxID=71717 RepID=A0A4Y7SLG5_COPMI|nr:general substrate transporter [Coprinellus micaceus]
MGTNSRTSSTDRSHAPLTEKSEHEGGIKALWKEKHVFSLALFSNLGGFLYGCEMSVFSGILVMSNFERSFPSITTNSVTMKGLVSSIIHLGAWLGAIQNGWRSITLASAFAILGAALQTGARNPGVLLYASFTGVGVGALSVGVPLYNSEISPRRIRGGLGSLFQLSIEFGTFLAFWIDFGCNYIGGTEDGQTEAAWRIPRSWLISRGRDEGARQALVSIRGKSGDSKEVEMEYLEILGQHKLEEELTDLEKDPNSGKKGVSAKLSNTWAQWSFLFRSAANRRRVLVGVIIMFFQYVLRLERMNGILFYAPTIFQSLGLSGTTVSLLATGVVGVVMLIATIPTVLYVDRFGRKPVLIIGALVMGVCHVIIAGLSGRYADSWESKQKIFPLRARSKGMAITGSSSWLNAFAVSMATPPMLESLKYGTYLFFAAWCFLAAVFCAFIPETAGRSLEDMDAAFGDTSGTSREDQERMNRINSEIGYAKYQAAKD